MPELPTPVLLAALLVLFASHLLGAITCYGSSLLAVPLLVWIFGDLQVTVIVLLVVGALQSYQVLFYTYRQIDFRRLLRMFGFALAGLPVGFVSMQRLPEKPLLAVLGLVLFAAGGYRLLPLSDRPERRPPDWLLNLLLFLGGMIHGAFATGGAVLVVCAQYLLHRKESFRATLASLWVVLNTAMIAGFLARGQLGDVPPVLMASSLAAVFAASWIGNALAGLIPAAAFRRLVAGILLLAGLMTAGKAL